MERNQIEKLNPNIEIGNKNQLKKIDWDLIEADYIHGYYDKKNKVIVYPTHQNLADIYGLRRGLITQRSSRRNWAIKRETYREMMSNQRMVEFGKERCFRMSVSMGDTIRRMEAINEIIDDKLANYDNDPNEYDIGAKDLALFQQIIANNHKLAKDLFGVEKSYEDMHKRASEEIYEKLREGDKVNAHDVAELINSLKEKTINVVAEEVNDDDESAEKDDINEVEMGRENCEDEDE